MYCYHYQIEIKNSRNKVINYYNKYNLDYDNVIKKSMYLNLSILHKDNSGLLDV